MQHDGESGQALADLLQHVEAQGRRHQNALLIDGALLGLELIRAVAGADGNGQGVTAGLGYELLHLLGTGVGRGVVSHLHVVLDTGQRAQLRFHDNTVVMGVFHHLAGDLDVLSKGLGGGVDHHGGEAAVDAALAGLKVGAVIQMQHDGDIGAGRYRRLHQLHQIGVVGVGAGALADLQDHGSVLLLAGLGDALYDLHVVDVERADGVAAIISLGEHFLGSYQCHVKVSFMINFASMHLLYGTFLLYHIFLDLQAQTVYNGYSTW